MTNRDNILLIVGLVMAVALGIGVFLMMGTDDGGELDLTGGSSDPAITEQDTSSSGARRAIPSPTIGAKKKTPIPTVADRVANAGLEGPSAAQITGIVYDPEDKPVVGALVALCQDVSDHPGFSLQGDLVAQAQTGEDGKFTIDGIEASDRYVMRVEHQDYTSHFTSKIDVEKGRSKRIVVRLSPGLSLMGEVKDKEGLPIAGATVAIYDQKHRAYDPERNIERMATSDANGQFVVENLNPGAKRAMARKDGYSTSTNNAIMLFDGKESAPLQFVLGKGDDISGICRDQVGQPVEGVLVNAQPIRTGPRSMGTANYPPVRTDVKGQFVMAGLAPGSYRLIAHMRGFPSRGAHVTARTGTNNVVLEMRRNMTISGQVQDPSGNPVTQYTLVTHREEFLVYRSHRMSHRISDDDGRFEITCDIDTGDFYLFAMADGFSCGRSEKLTATAAQDGDSNAVNVVIYMQQGAEVHGRIVNSLGEGIAGARVRLAPESASTAGAELGFFKHLIQNSMKAVDYICKTDAEGNYTVKNVHEGLFYVEATHAEFSKTKMEDSHSIPNGGEMTMPVLAMMRGGTLKGIVYDSNGDPDPTARVQLRPKQQLAGTGYTARTNGAGRFEVTRIQPGIYTVEVVERKGEPVNPFARLLNMKNGVQEEVMIGDGDLQELELR